MVSEALALGVGRIAYALVFVLAVVGLYVLCASRNLLKRAAGLAVLQGALALFYVVMAGQYGARAPALQPDEAPYAQAYASPAPQAQIVGACVVGAASVLLAFALIVRVRETYGVIEENEIDVADDAQDRAERDA